MALTRRCPVDDEDRNSLLDAAAQALWQTATSCRDHWLNPTGGFDRRISGCAAPEGVILLMPDS